MLQLGQFRSCRGKLAKPTVKESTLDSKGKPRISSPIIIGPPINHSHAQQQHQRNRAATSGSDVSVVRNEHTQGLNRNSSSGYVSTIRYYMFYYLFKNGLHENLYFLL